MSIHDCFEIARSDRYFGIYMGIIIGFCAGIIFSLWWSTKVSFFGRGKG